jgi:hypothetical protein
LECDGIKAEIEVQREKQALQAASMPKFLKWVKQNPMPRTEGGKDRWSKRARKANPHIVITTKLNYDIHFLIFCSSFPTKHWLELPAEERERFATQLAPDRVQWGHDAFHMEKRPMLIQSLKDFQSSPFRQFDHVFTAKVAEHSGDFVVSWCWPRSDRKLLEDFKQWLEENRPPDQPPLHTTSESASRKTSHRDLLKALGALRLTRAFKNNFIEARYHAWEVLPKPLYKDQAAWIKATNRAKQQIETFQSKMLRI